MRTVGQASFAFFAFLAPMDDADLVELRGLVDQAFELRDTPYLRDACEYILDWRARTNLRHVEREGRVVSGQVVDGRATACAALTAPSVGLS